MTKIILHKIDVRCAEDTLRARQEAKRAAQALRFRPEDCDRVGIMASELTSNLIKHAGGGCIEVCQLEEGGRRGISLVARDRGPGIPDVEAALRPGYSTAGSFGDGLATVVELADALSVDTEVGAGTRVEAVKWAT